jgi:hypothetical protein
MLTQLTIQAIKDNINTMKTLLFILTSFLICCIKLPCFFFIKGSLLPVFNVSAHNSNSDLFPIMKEYNKVSSDINIPLNVMYMVNASDNKL